MGVSATNNDDFQPLVPSQVGETVERADSLDEAEPAGSLLMPVQPHDDTLDLSHPAEQLVDLLLSRVETAASGRTV